MSPAAIFVGIRGAVLALEPSSGIEIWRAELKGGDFVNVVVHEGNVFASTKGEVFCLDAATGTVKWNNPLKGLGLGLVSLALPGVQTGQLPPVRKRQQDQEQAAGAAVTAAG